MGRKLQFEWEIPDDIFDERFPMEHLLAGVKEDTVVRLFKEGRVSTGYGAALLGLTRREIFDLLAQRGVPYLALSAQEFAQEVEAARRLVQEGGRPDESPT